MANYYKEIANMLGLELDEEYGLTLYEDYVFKITEKGFFYKHKEANEYGGCSWDMLKQVFDGEKRIIKQPFKPKISDIYYFYYDAGIYFATWCDSIKDFKNYYCGNCFKTKKEAEEHKDEIIKNLKEHYENS